jgi:hypothetical protein
MNWEKCERTHGSGDPWHQLLFPHVFLHYLFSYFLTLDVICLMPEMAGGIFRAANSNSKSYLNVNPLSARIIS